MAAMSGPVVYYAVRQPGYAHPMASFFSTLLVERWDASYDDEEPRSLRTWLVLGGLLGMCALVRPQLVLWGVLLVHAAVDDLRKSRARGRPARSPTGALAGKRRPRRRHVHPAARRVEIPLRPVARRTPGGALHALGRSLLERGPLLLTEWPVSVVARLSSVCHRADRRRRASRFCTSAPLHRSGGRIRPADDRQRSGLGLVGWRLLRRKALRFGLRRLRRRCVAARRLGYRAHRAGSSAWCCAGRTNRRGGEPLPASSSSFN